jgi:hypothetical protein
MTIWQNDIITTWEKSKIPKLQIFEITNILNFKYSKFQIFQIANIQNCKYSKLQIFKISNIQNCKYSKLQIFKIAKIQNSKIDIKWQWKRNYWKWSEIDILTFLMIFYSILWYLRCLRYLENLIKIDYYLIALQRNIKNSRTFKEIERSERKKERNNNLRELEEGNCEMAIFRIFKEKVELEYNK